MLRNMSAAELVHLTAFWTHFKYIFLEIPLKPWIHLAFMSAQGAQQMVCYTAHSYARGMIICTIGFLKRSTWCL